VGDEDHFEIFGHHKVLGLVDAITEYINDGEENLIENAKSEGNTALVKDLERINSTYFVFAISWLDILYMDILVFDRAYNFYLINYSHEMHLYENVLKVLDTSFIKHKSLLSLLHNFINVMAIEMEYVESDKDPEELKYNLSRQCD
jgi:hypothetical protein